MNLKNLFLALFALILVSTHAPAQIRAGKAIRITISNVPPEDKANVNGDYPVSDNGTINLPMIGTVHAAGMSSGALQNVIQERYKSAEIYTNPTIQVIVDAEASVAQELVTVGGQVNKTGPVVYTRELTLWQAIQNAGGATPYGSMKRVMLTRDGKQRQYDVTKSQNKSIILQRNDNIEVPQKDLLGN